MSIVAVSEASRSLADPIVSSGKRCGTERTTKNGPATSTHEWTSESRAFWHWLWTIMTGSMQT